MGDLEVGYFLNNYLEKNIPLISQFYEDTNFDIFLNTQICKIPILHLQCFINCCYFQIYEQKGQNTKDFWDNMESLITYEFGILIENL